MKAVDPIRNYEEINEFEEKMRTIGEREHILFLLGIYTGLRISDLLKLKVQDVRNKTHLILQEQKTKKMKKVFINRYLKTELKKYITGKSSNNFLVQSREGQNKPLSRQRIWQVLKKVSKEIGLDSIGCHTLRKTFGYHYYNKTKDVVFLQELYNHSSPAITLRYIGTSQDLKDKAINNMDFRRK
ncbi:MAG: tyrosine-type recombinase/integrase [Psychrilyobacter sp.]|uniref:tyrosine-type recombinase/integrase n=1 Tax=Psychrilyobacter sp. TaxID=2586924 RepID=UPI003C7255FB